MIWIQDEVKRILLTEEGLRGQDIVIKTRDLSLPARVDSNPARTDVTVWESLSVYLQKVGGPFPNALHNNVSGFSPPPIITDRRLITEKLLSMAKNSKQSILQNNQSCRFLHIRQQYSRNRDSCECSANLAIRANIHHDVRMSAPCSNRVPYSSRGMFYETRHGIRADEHWNLQAVGSST
jgi:hypothetical protein